jgi:hypothetical protein
VHEHGLKPADGQQPCRRRPTSIVASGYEPNATTCHPAPKLDAEWQQGSRSSCQPRTRF